MEINISEDLKNLIEKNMNVKLNEYTLIEVCGNEDIKSSKNKDKFGYAILNNKDDFIIFKFFDGSITSIFNAEKLSDSVKLYSNNTQRLISKFNKKRYLRKTVAINVVDENYYILNLYGKFRSEHYISSGCPFKDKNMFKLIELDTFLKLNENKVINFEKEEA